MQKQGIIHEPAFLLTAKQAAELLSIGRSTLWREVKAGQLPAPVKIAGSTRWRRGELVRFVEELPRAECFATGLGRE